MYLFQPILCSATFNDVPSYFKCTRMYVFLCVHNVMFVNARALCKYIFR